jgi:hypothetical protein
LAQGTNATNPRYCQPIINKQDNIFQYSSLVASLEVYLNIILILESGKARNKAFSRRLFSVLAPKSLAYFSSGEIVLKGRIALSFYHVVPQKTSKIIESSWSISTEVSTICAKYRDTVLQLFSDTHSISVHMCLDAA